MKTKENIDMIDRYLEQDYWIIDTFPMQVPTTHANQYFKAEKYFLNHQHFDDLYKKFAHILIKLSCYEELKLILLTDECIVHPDPVTIERLVVDQRRFFVVMESVDSMIGVSGEDTYLTLYHPNDELLELVRCLATAEGLFVWKPINGKELKNIPSIK